MSKSTNMIMINLLDKIKVRSSLNQVEQVKFDLIAVICDWINGDPNIGKLIIL
ncbi:hypothetical protein Goshw_013233 [Gossypium schwendimanii]|uniref:Uncharacterized protein n=1 Tax=Gossypium schwendimanii TaxID=34291 RepID=A0A7J9L2T7_GOSSC|nr:hypothetical protein [Gossypium schwendimanii]